MVLPAKSELSSRSGASEHGKGWDEAKVNDAASHPSQCSGALSGPLQGKLSEDDGVSLNNMNAVFLPSDVSLQGVNGDIFPEDILQDALESLCDSDDDVSESNVATGNDWANQAILSPLDPLIILGQLGARNGVTLQAGNRASENGSNTGSEIGAYIASGDPLNVVGQSGVLPINDGVTLQGGHNSERSEHISNIGSESGEKRTFSDRDKIIGRGAQMCNLCGKARRGHVCEWCRKFDLLEEYKDKNGNCDVPQKLPLGTWVNKQRTEKKKLDKGEKKSMTREQCNRLESIGFKWAKPKGQAAWNKSYEELKEYQKKHGNCIVPTRYKDNPALGRWITSQRADIKNGDIDKDNEKKLNDIGFVWDCYDKNEA